MFPNYESGGGQCYLDHGGGAQMHHHQLIAPPPPPSPAAVAAAYHQLHQQHHGNGGIVNGHQQLHHAQQQAQHQAPGPHRNHHQHTRVNPYEPYASEGFDQGSPRYPSPKAQPSLYGEPYFIDGGPWRSRRPLVLKPKPAAFFILLLGEPDLTPALHVVCLLLHAPPSRINGVWCCVSRPGAHRPNAHHPAPPSTGTSGTAAGSTNQGSSPGPTAADALSSRTAGAAASANSSAHPPPASSQTGDTLGKAIASMYSADHPGSSFSSTSSTPVSSPPPLCAVTQWPRNNAQSSQPPSGFQEATMHQLQTRVGMEERLDDALSILRTHAEGASLAPASMGPTLGLTPGAHSNGLLASLTAGHPFSPGMPTLDAHGASPPALSDSSMRSRTSLTTPNSQNPAHYVESSPGIKVEKCKEADKLEHTKISPPNSPGPLGASLTTPTATSSSGGGKSSKRSRSVCIP
ncbi:hypothetical protein MTO96_024836 [Rhipicephalus appendiculatus]